MATLPITSSTANSASNKSSSSVPAGYNLTPSDFIKMMVTQLKNQDPMSPTSNTDLLNQMSQIGQLQSSTTLTDSLKTMTLQNSIGSAAALIGKSVQGLDANGAPLAGLVNSVQVQNGAVNLELDNGTSLALDHVTSIAPTTAGVKASS